MKSFKHKPIIKIEKLEKPPNLITNVNFKSLVRKHTLEDLPKLECNYGYSISKNVNKKLKKEKPEEI